MTEFQLIKIHNIKSGAELTGNWAGLRKKLGIVRRNRMTAEQSEELFGSLGWKVVEINGDPVETKLDDRAHNIARQNAVETLNPAEENEGVAPDLNPETRQTFSGETTILKSTVELTIPEINLDYVHREVDTVIATVLENLTDEFLYIFGGAGTGKTESIKQYCAERGEHFTRISMDETMSLQYLIGRLWFSDNRVVYKEGMLVKAIQQPGVVLLDEANTPPPSRTFLLHQLLDSNAIYIAEADKWYHIHPECRIVFAGNYQSGAYAGVQKMNEAFRSRLTCLEMPELSPSLVKFKNIPPYERDRFLKLYSETQALVGDKSSKVHVTLRNLLRYDKLRGAGFDAEMALRLSLIDGVKYADTGLGEELEALAKTHMNDLYISTKTDKDIVQYWTKGESEAEVEEEEAEEEKGISGKIIDELEGISREEELEAQRQTEIEDDFPED